MFQKIIKLLIIKQSFPEHGQALSVCADSPAARPASLST